MQIWQYKLDETLRFLHLTPLLQEEDSGWTDIFLIYVHLRDKHFKIIKISTYLYLLEKHTHTKLKNVYPAENAAKWGWECFSKTTYFKR